MLAVFFAVLTAAVAIAATRLCQRLRWMDEAAAAAARPELRSGHGVGGGGWATGVFRLSSAPRRPAG